MSIIKDSKHCVEVPLALSEEEQPRIVGDIQPDIHAGPEWSPAESTAFLTANDNDYLYTYKAEVPKGKHEFKIVLGNGWDRPAFPQDNYKLMVYQKTLITFFYNHDTKEVYTDYDPGERNGAVDGDKLYHDSLDKLYRSPFGAVKAGEKVRFRLQAKHGDLTYAKMHLKNHTTRKNKEIDMEYAGWAEVDGAAVEFWEANVTPEEIGVYSYIFIARDEEAIKEYSGNEGTANDTSSGLFQITVYDPDYKTPDWMKEAVVYQIFPDRFYNGDRQNDRAKDSARGHERVEYRQ